MTWIALGALISSFVYPLHRVANYYHTRYKSSVGQTTVQKSERYMNIFIALAQVVLLVGVVLIVWGGMSFLPDETVVGGPSASEVTNPSGWAPGRMPGP